MTKHSRMLLCRKFLKEEPTEGIQVLVGERARRVLMIVDERVTMYKVKVDDGSAKYF